MTHSNLTGRGKKDLNSILKQLINRVLRLVSIGSRNQEHGYLGHDFMFQALVIVYSQIINIFLKDTKREITDNR